MAVIDRRGVLAGGLALVAARARAAAPAGDGTVVFEARRNGSKIGQHVLRFAHGPGGWLTVRIDAQFRVGFGPITLYRYHHQGVERWQNDQFVSLETSTDDNGTQFDVRARRVGQGVAITATNQPSVLAPAGALPLTHWALAAMSAPLFNPQTGKLLHEVARPRGPGMVTLADGKAIPATGYTLAGEAPIEDWYDRDGFWAALDAVGKDGSAIAYRRI